MMATRPSTPIPNWTNGEPSQVAAPTPALLASGYSAGEAPGALNFNWMWNLQNTWLQYLDAVTTGASGGSGQQTTSNGKLVGGGTWTFNATTGVVAWSQTASISYPGVPSSVNALTSGSVTLADGKVAYVTPNAPYTTTVNIASGSAQLSNVASFAGAVVGATVTGAGIPANTTITVVGTTTITLSNAATATTTNANVSFVASSTLSTTVADLTAAPASGAVVIASRYGNLAYVGLGGVGVILRDGESKQLYQSGFLSTVQATAGQALTAGQPVYMSQGATDGRTVGQLYPVDAGATNAANRSASCGVVMTSVASGAVATSVCSGLVSMYSGLTIGATYYANPATPGGITTTIPTTPGQAVLPIGVATSATSIQLSASLLGGASIIGTGLSWPQYSATSEASFIAALTAMASTGGIILIANAFTLTTAQTIPSRTTLQGRRGGSIITVASGAGLTLAGNADIRDVYFVTTASQSIVKMPNNYSRVKGCRFDLTGATGASGVYVTGIANRIEDNHFLNVESVSALNNGIVYAGGVSNIDTNSMAIS